MKELLKELRCSILQFETHATSLDNEQGIASGHFDVGLSPLGQMQASAMGERYALHPLAAVYTSDLARAADTARIAFAGRQVPILTDSRLRECDYGDLTRESVARIEGMRLACIEKCFPNGESYNQVIQRVRHFLEGLEPNRNILVIGHRATWYAFEHLLAGRDLAAVIGAPWAWQPGWTYRL